MRAKRVGAGVEDNPVGQGRGKTALEIGIGRAQPENRQPGPVDDRREPQAERPSGAMVLETVEHEGGLVGVGQVVETLIAARRLRLPARRPGRIRQGPPTSARRRSGVASALADERVGRLLVVVDQGNALNARRAIEPEEPIVRSEPRRA